MLAYRHAFHAGNHADVLKHAVLVAALKHLAQKDKGFRVVDTHAGAGAYALHAPQAQKKGEYHDGIERLWATRGLPALLSDYLVQVRAFNGSGELQRYPGSPALARALLRPQDELSLYELHPTDHALLDRQFNGDRQVHVGRGDGFAGLKAQLPPPTRRGLVIIDPSYELKTDYAAVVAAARDTLTRFADAVLLIWYPQLTLREAAQLPQRLKVVAQAQAKKGWLHARLSVAEPDQHGYGLLGSGMFIINPPHPLKAALSAALPVLQDKLAQWPGSSRLLEAAHGV